ncbi:MAG: hypothetical protein COB33_015230 [Thiotrichaceae bacterium]|nr:hypothetical protein [Thiotrichaceae bacterium]
MGVYSVDKLITEARRLAADYRRATGKPLAGVSGEVAQYDAVRLLDLELCNPPIAGCDAIGNSGSRKGKKVQIKARTIFDEAKTGQRIGQLKLEQAWDLVVLVLLDEELETFEVYEASRTVLKEAMEEGGSSKRAKRGAMSVAKFKIISRLAWTRENGLEGDEAWDNQADG